MLETIGPLPAEEDELPEAFRLIFQHVPPVEREGRVENALRLLRQGELDPQGILVVRSHRRLIGALVCIPVPGASALVWPPQAIDGPDKEQVEDLLLGHAIGWLRQRGGKLGQTLLGRQEARLAPPLLRNGFQHITGLWYLRYDFQKSPSIPAYKYALSYRSYASGDPDSFHETLLRTYEGTRDCPEVNGVRTLEEIMAGHESQGIHDPERWWLAEREGKAVGLLMLTETPEWQAWDISYIGVVPEARRQGVGKEMACKALEEARRAGASQLTLAVDARNEPAWKLYLGLGFEIFDEREVYLAIWNDRPS